MSDLSRDDVLARIQSRKAELRALEVPEWEGTVYLRKLSIGDLHRFDSFQANGNNSLAVVTNLVLGLCNAEGEALFTKADAQRLMDADLAVATRISQEINRYNGLGETEVEQVAEDFGEAQSDDSSSE